MSSNQQLITRAYEGGSELTWTFFPLKTWAPENKTFFWTGGHNWQVAMHATFVD
jgi:hypothetical protein